MKHIHHLHIYHTTAVQCGGDFTLFSGFALDGWLENTLTMGSDMPRNEMTIKKSAVEAIINCKTFEPLKDDVHFQNIIKRLKTLEENG